MRLCGYGSPGSRNEWAQAWGGLGAVAARGQCKRISMLLTAAASAPRHHCKRVQMDSTRCRVAELAARSYAWPNAITPTAWDCRRTASGVAACPYVPVHLRHGLACTAELPTLGGMVASVTPAASCHANL